MIRIFALLCFFVSIEAIAQLSVKPNGTTDSFVYVQNEILFVTQDVNLTKNATPDPGNMVALESGREASIYLRGEAQLIQGNNSLNTGDGMLSVFQEGSTNLYDYNNWTSPVSYQIASGGGAIAAGNGTFGASTLHVPLTKTGAKKIELIGGFDSSYNTTTNTLQIPEYWFFWLPEGLDDNQSHFRQVASDDYTISAGYGFTMKGVTDPDNTIADTTSFDGRENNPGSSQRYDFRGRPNNGTIQIGHKGGHPVIGANNFIFLGNPYPSAIDLAEFLIENSAGPDYNSCIDGTTRPRKNNIDGIAYFWDSDPAVDTHFYVETVGGYEMYAPVDCNTDGMSMPAVYFRYNNDGSQIENSEVTAPTTTPEGRNRRFAPIAQGFLVKTVETAFENTITFENRQRVFIQEKDMSNPNIFKRKENSPTKTMAGRELQVIPKLKLNIEINQDYTRQLALGFWPTATDGVDRAMDAEIIDLVSTDAGFLQQDGKSYGIDVRPFDISLRIPLYLTVSKQADFKFTATSFENFNTEEVYVYDSEDDAYYDINYTSWSTTLDQGDYNGRFFLVFEKEEVLNTDEFAANNFDIFQNNTASQLEIKNPNAIDIQSVAIYDILGKQILLERNLGGRSSYAFSTRNLQEAIYVVKLVTSNDVSISKKITVYNRN